MDSQEAVLHSEFFISTGYFERLVFALTDLAEFHYTPTGRKLFQKIIESYHLYFSKELNFNPESPELEFQLSNFRTVIKKYHQYTEKYLALPFSNEQKNLFGINFINLCYENAHEMHNHILKFTNYEIQYPRMSLIKEKEFNSKEEDLTNSKLFFIDQNDFNELAKEMKHNQNVNFLDLKREEKYDHFVHKGHTFISEKNYTKAQEAFYKAKNYKETAEVFTLIAWSYSFDNQYEKAKNNCLKAITKDPQYGPAYNDFGNYLLQEGNVKESFKWFELAKRALNYQNREYPYINSGRAYMMLEDYERALREFSTALILAPYHEELHDTVKKIKLNLEKSYYKPNLVNNNYESQHT